VVDGRLAVADRQLVHVDLNEIRSRVARLTAEW
jgi:hypothetical protein